MGLSGEQFGRTNNDNDDGINKLHGKESAGAGEEPTVWHDLEQLIKGGRVSQLAWLALIGLTLVLLIFLVTGFLLATAVLMTTFYFFINEHHHQQLMMHRADMPPHLPGMELSS
nr:uncharacterized protein LOC109411969 [Aedes albopictus]